MVNTPHPGFNIRGVAFCYPEDKDLTVFPLAQVVGSTMHLSDDLEETARFSLAGPLPEMAFPSNQELIPIFARGDAQRIHVWQHT